MELGGGRPCVYAFLSMSKSRCCSDASLCPLSTARLTLDLCMPSLSASDVVLIPSSFTGKFGDSRDIFTFHQELTSTNEEANLKAFDLGFEAL